LILFARASFFFAHFFPSFGLLGNSVLVAAFCHHSLGDSKLNKLRKLIISVDLCRLECSQVAALATEYNRLALAPVEKISPMTGGAVAASDSATSTTMTSFTAELSAPSATTAATAGVFALESVAAKVEAGMRALGKVVGEDAVFVRLSSRSPKDAVIRSPAIDFVSACVSFVSRVVSCFYGSFPPFFPFRPFRPFRPFPQ
jgi:hypothetical protein